MPKHHPDYIFLLALTLIVSIGVIMIFSTSTIVATSYYGDSYYFIKRHFMYLLAGFFVFLVGYRINLDWIRNGISWGILVVIVTLLATYLPGLGLNVYGAQRWLALGPFSFQPSELSKLVMVIFVAHAIENKGDLLTDFWKGVMPILSIIGVVAGLIILQPDLGTTLQLGTTIFAMLFVGGMKMKHMTGLSLFVLVGLAIEISMKPYQLQRITAYMDPWKDPLGINFHLIQSWLAVGSGGFFGLGIGNSKLKFSYLPQQYTDFVFAILCEEGGFILAAITVLIWGVFAIRGFRVGLMVKNQYYRLLAFGFTFSLSAQALINICVVLGILPTTGIPLTFISFGGTSLMVSLFSAGIVANVSRYTDEEFE